MYRNIKENYEVDSTSIAGADEVFAPGLSGDTALSADIITSPSTVSSGDMASAIVTDNYVMDTAGTAVYGTAQVLADSETQAEILSCLETINYRLSIIVFLLLFYWCYRRLKSAVFKFTGRGID